MKRARAGSMVLQTGTDDHLVVTEASAAVIAASLKLRDHDEQILQYKNEDATLPKDGEMDVKWIK